jgi:hypothetical protein
MIHALEATADLTIDNKQSLLEESDQLSLYNTAKLRISLFVEMELLKFSYEPQSEDRKRGQRQTTKK